ncbi:MAG: CDP-alcohol phosphatidyltransferase family protein, partial [Deltaproteobacteria bacterium]|nr:CDP-alcohol phosphatidyltransferase family protein [Deltaproteobacteria bacterium]
TELVQQLGSGATTLELGAVFWRPAGSAAEQAEAHAALVRSLRKRVDGPISRRVNRPISMSITRLLMNTRITPNQMTGVATVFGAAGVILVFQATWLTLVLGAIGVQLQSILDGCDGELARLKLQSSRFGEWLDNVLDDHVNVAYGIALGYAASRMLGEPLWLWVGIAAGAAFTVHNLIFYAQLIFIHHSGSPFAFKWWFESSTQDVTELLASDSLGAQLGSFGRALARRDVFLFCFLLLAIARLPHIAVIWYGLVAASQIGLMAIHVAMGGFTKHATR